MFFPHFIAPRYSKNYDIFLLSLPSPYLYFPLLGVRDFWVPVEPRYGEIPRVMFAKGEWDRADRQW